MHKTYIIGVSGGPDSMALFDMCVRQGIHVIAAHMNYQKRESATRDMKIVERYCESHSITLKKRMQNKECVGNFQAFAREQRYAFYKELLDEYKADAVLLAHHMDDHLETYIMQKESHRFSAFYGIKECNQVMGCVIIRPLLMFTKAELEAYCVENEIPFGIDESNLDNHYTRNRIRHEMIEHMSYEEKIELVNTITQENAQRISLCKKADVFIRTWNHDVNMLLTLSEDEVKQVIASYIFQECSVHETLAVINQIYHHIMVGANHWTRDIAKTYCIYNEYGKLCVDTKEKFSYSYVYESLCYDKTPFFEITKKGSSVEALSLIKEDFPITIRNYIEGDEILLRFGTKKINRWFIDRKIPKKERKKWPVVVNAQGNVILVPKIGCDIAHFSNNPTCFVLK